MTKPKKTVFKITCIDDEVEDIAYGATHLTRNADGRLTDASFKTLYDLIDKIHNDLYKMQTRIKETVNQRRLDDIVYRKE